MLKQLGNTDLYIPAIGQGTAFDFTKITKNNAAAIVRKGIEAGLTFIDTAESYGGGYAEEAVGEATKGIRNKVVIATKFSPEHSARKEVIRACEASLKKLQSDYIDLYQFHWPNPAVPAEETVSALRQLLKEGKVRYIGAGNCAGEELKKLQELVGKEKLVSLQTEYNLFERTVEQNGVLEFCEQNKISLIAYSPLDQGRFADMKSGQKQVLERIARKYGKTAAQIILRWLISRTPVIAIPKTSHLERVKENAEGMSFDLGAEEIGLIDKAFFVKLEFVPVEKINLPEVTETNSKVKYRTLEEALENKLGFTPSPKDLAETLKRGSFLKPVHLVPSRDRVRGYEFDIVGGRIRYWAWVIAFGDKKPLPAYIRDGK